jgi:hypothetical protein
MVYTDEIHLVADTMEELHEFADQIGLKRCWYHNKRGKNHPHYDIWGSKLKEALNKGAKVISSKELVKIANLLGYTNQRSNKK